MHLDIHFKKIRVIIDVEGSVGTYLKKNPTKYL